VPVACLRAARHLRPLCLTCLDQTTAEMQKSTRCCGAPLGMSPRAEAAYPGDHRQRWSGIARTGQVAPAGPRGRCAPGSHFNGRLPRIGTLSTRPRVSNPGSLWCVFPIGPARHSLITNRSRAWRTLRPVTSSYSDWKQRKEPVWLYWVVIALLAGVVAGVFAIG
jgi:hypothetical protein